MQHKDGNLFDTTADIIAHGVNCKGVMGAGIAKTFRAAYPDMYYAYKGLCNEGKLNPGDYFAWYDTSSEKMVVNLASQNNPGPNASYEWLTNSVLSFATALDANAYIYGERYGRTIAIPEIGCGIGGLEWPIVELILEAVETRFDIEFEVWHYK